MIKYARAFFRVEKNDARWYSKKNSALTINLEKQ